MEFFRDAYSVRLVGHKGKYLWADEDRKSVAQKKGQDSYGAIWRVELVPDRNALRLKSVYDLYLMASEYAFLLGATGKKVMQSFASKADSALEWEPLGAGTFVKLKTKGHKFLRANGGMPPYRNSVTHDVPVLASNQHVVLWEVEVVRKKDSTSMPPSRLISTRTSNVARPKSSPALPLQPHVESSDDEIPAPAPVNVHKPRPGTNAVSTKIEIPPTAEYISSPSEPASPVASPPPLRRASPPSESVSNAPVRRRGTPPCETYDQPRPQCRRASLPSNDDYGSSASEPSSPRGCHGLAPQRRTPLPIRDNYDSSPSEPSLPRRSASPLDEKENSGRSRSQNVKSPDIRRIFYSVAEDDGEVLAHDDETYGTFMFQGHSLAELTEELQRATGINEDIILCMRNPLSAKLYKMRLALPPNNAPLSIVIVRSNSQFGRTFSTQTSRQR